MMPSKESYWRFLQTFISIHFKKIKIKKCTAIMNFMNFDYGSTLQKLPCTCDLHRHDLLHRVRVTEHVCEVGSSDERP